MRYSSLPLESLQSWAHINNIKLNSIKIQSHIIDDSGVDRGGGLVASSDLAPSSVLLTIPRELTLNKSHIEDALRTDKWLREVFNAVDATFLQTPRLAIMLFLLLQLTYSSPDIVRQKMGVALPLSDYVKFLPKGIYLPTVYSEQEQALLIGTSLDAALQQKLKKLQTEFDHLKLATEHIDWCQEIWWDENEGILSIMDWKLVDAIYRSRALELPSGIGDSMVPVLDMANHLSDTKYNARFRLDKDHNVQLVVRDDVAIAAGQEVTIMYGCGGACEMIFSYGFLDQDAQSAREMFLDLQIPDDDPLKRAKVEFAREAPGVRIYTNSREEVQWESSYIWWACVNQEDGLDFEILQQVDGTMELKALWKGIHFGAKNLKKMLMEDPSWDIFLLRAIVMIQERVETQGTELSGSQDAFDTYSRYGDGNPVLDTVRRLRDLEMELLVASHQALEVDKTRLLNSDIVRAYLSGKDPDRSDGAKDEDFS